MVNDRRHIDNKVRGSLLPDGLMGFRCYVCNTFYRDRPLPERSLGRRHPDRACLAALQATKADQLEQLARTDALLAGVIRRVHDRQLARRRG